MDSNKWRNIVAILSCDLDLENNNENIRKKYKFLLK
jgi:hypothetical protein